VFLIPIGGGLFVLAVIIAAIFGDRQARFILKVSFWFFLVLGLLLWLAYELYIA
jgi:lipid-A-disaccharide synthase-like uncharacterized protein